MEWLGIHTRVGILIPQEELHLVIPIHQWQLWFVLVICHRGITTCGILILLRVVFQGHIYCDECRD